MVDVLMKYDALMKKKIIAYFWPYVSEGIIYLCEWSTHCINI